MMPNVPPPPPRRVAPPPDPLPPGAALVGPPVCSEEVEGWLRSRNVNFLRCMEIPLGNFDEKASRANQARPTGLIAEAVDRYTVAMKAHPAKSGGGFPPLVAYRTSDKSTTFIIIDGNNRHAAAKKAGLKAFPTYVLASDTPAPLIYLLTVEANAKHGQPVPTEWRVKQALHLVEIGWTLDVASEAAGIPVSTVKLHKAVNEIDDRVRPLKINGWSELPASTRHKLGQVRSDPVLYQATRLAVDTSMTTSEVGALVREVKATRSQDEAIAHITHVSEERHAAMEERRKMNRKPRTISNVLQSVVTACGKIMAADTAAMMRLALTDVERQRLWNRLSETAEKIIELQIALEQVMKEARGDDDAATA